MGEAKRRRARGYRPPDRKPAIPGMTLGAIIPMYQVPPEADAPLFTPVGVLAVHEAAHSVVAERSGFPVAWTRLTLDGRPIHSLVETGTSLGATEYVLKYRNGGIRFGRPDGRAAVAGHIMASLAGPASAELLLRGYVSDEDLRRITAVSATGDVARARALTEFLCRIEQALPREDAIVDDRQLSLTIDMAPTCAAHVEAAYGNLTRRMRATAEAAFPAIKAVAHALLANSHRLEGEAVRAIIARTVP